MLINSPYYALISAHYARIMLEYLNSFMPKVYYTQYTCKIQRFNVSYWR